MPLSVFIIGVGIIPVVLFRVTRACTLGVARMLARVVGVGDVCACNTPVFLDFLLHCEIFLLIVPMLDHAVECWLLYEILDGCCECSCDLHGPIYWGFSRYLDMCGVQLVLGGCSVSPC